jgi:hypothetical protein
MASLNTHPQLRSSTRQAVEHIPQMHPNGPVTQISRTTSSYTPAQPFPDGSISCTRCCLSFSSHALYETHVEDSLDHHICPLCEYKKDFETFTSLQDHLEMDHLWCEPCNWFAASDEALQKHFVHKHMMCSVCKETFKGLNELTGHANSHRPLTVPCFLCEEAFALRSATFNHIESEKCDGGALREDVRYVVKDFLGKLPRNMGYQVLDNRLFSCHTCHKSYARLSDLLQHVETRSCPEGYCKGTGVTEHMVQYVQANLKAIIERRKSSEIQQQAGMGSTVPGGVAIHPRIRMLQNEEF